MGIRVWKNGVEVHHKQLHWLLANTKFVFGLWSQFHEVLRYSTDDAEVDIVTKSADIAPQIEQLRNNGDNDKVYDFLAEQLNLMCQAP